MIEFLAEDIHRQKYRKGSRVGINAFYFKAVRFVLIRLFQFQCIADFHSIFFGITVGNRHAVLKQFSGNIFAVFLNSIYRNALALPVFRNILQRCDGKRFHALRICLQRRRQKLLHNSHQRVLIILIDRIRDI